MELAGRCCLCGKEIYSRDGFLEGNIEDHLALICLTCSETRNKEGLRSI